MKGAHITFYFRLVVFFLFCFLPKYRFCCDVLQHNLFTCCRFFSEVMLDIGNNNSTSLGRRTGSTFSMLRSERNSMCRGLRYFAALHWKNDIFGVYFPFQTRCFQQTHWYINVNALLPQLFFVGMFLERTPPVIWSAGLLRWSSRQTELDVDTTWHNTFWKSCCMLFEMDLNASEQPQEKPCEVWRMEDPMTCNEVLFWNKLVSSCCNALTSSAWVVQRVFKNSGIEGNAMLLSKCGLQTRRRASLPYVGFEGEGHANDERTPSLPWRSSNTETAQWVATTFFYHLCFTSMAWAKASWRNRVSNPLLAPGIDQHYFR